MDWGSDHQPNTSININCTHQRNVYFLVSLVVSCDFDSAIRQRQQKVARKKSRNSFRKLTWMHVQMTPQTGLVLILLLVDLCTVNLQMIINRR